MKTNVKGFHYHAYVPGNNTLNPRKDVRLTRGLQTQFRFVTISSSFVQGRRVKKEETHWGVRRVVEVLVVREARGGRHEVALHVTLMLK